MSAPAPASGTPLFRRNGGYALQHPARGNSAGRVEQLTNYELETDKIHKGEDGRPSVTLTIHPSGNGRTLQRTMPFTKFNSVYALKNTTAVGIGTIYYGSSQRGVNELRLFVSQQDAPEVEA